MLVQKLDYGHSGLKTYPSENDYEYSVQQKAPEDQRIVLQHLVDVVAAIASRVDDLPKATHSLLHLPTVQRLET